MGMRHSQVAGSLWSSRTSEKSTMPDSSLIFILPRSYGWGGTVKPSPRRGMKELKPLPDMLTAALMPGRNVAMERARSAPLDKPKTPIPVSFTWNTVMKQPLSTTPHLLGWHNISSSASSLIQLRPPVFYHLPLSVQVTSLPYLSLCWASTRLTMNPTAPKIFSSYNIFSFWWPLQTEPLCSHHILARHLLSVLYLLPLLLPTPLQSSLLRSPLENHFFMGLLALIFFHAIVFWYAPTADLLSSGLSLNA